MAILIKTLSIIDSIQKVVKGLPVVGAQEEVPWIRAQIERVFFETEIGRIHETLT